MVEHAVLVAETDRSSCCNLQVQWWRWTGRRSADGYTDIEGELWRTDDGRQHWDWRLQQGWFQAIEARTS